MRPDPPIDEIRAVRHRISARFGHDTQALIEHYQQLQERYADRLLRDPAERTPPAPAPLAHPTPTKLGR